MDRPFRELHELYKILFERAEAQKTAEEERRAQEEKDAAEKEKAEVARGAKLPQIRRAPPPDAVTSPNNLTPSPLEAEALEEAFEELAEGGV